MIRSYYFDWTTISALSSQRIGLARWRLLERLANASQLNGCSVGNKHLPDLLQAN